MSDAHWCHSRLLEFKHRSRSILFCLSLMSVEPWLTEVTSIITSVFKRHIPSHHSHVFIMSIYPHVSYTINLNSHNQIDPIALVRQILIGRRRPINDRNIYWQLQQSPQRIDNCPQQIPVMRTSMTFEFTQTKCQILLSVNTDKILNKLHWCHFLGPSPSAQTFNARCSSPGRHQNQGPSYNF